MAIEVFSIIDCPFCDGYRGAGGIYLDTRVVSGLHENRYTVPFAGSESTAPAILFNSDLPGKQPCPHLLQIELAISTDLDDNEWEATFEWRTPVIGEIDPQNRVEEFLCDLWLDEEHERFRPTEPSSFHLIDNFWVEYGASPRRQQRYYVEGSAAFARRIPEFLKSAIDADQRRVRAWRAGQNTKGEWAKIKRYRELKREEELRCTFQDLKAVCEKTTGAKRKKK